MRVIVVGGGAAGFFAALACAETNPAARVCILERGGQTLAKVRISGGGRCNLTHEWGDLREFCACYPRGGRALLGPLHRFGPKETVAWFEARGVALKTEADGRLFPVTDRAETVASCLEREAGRLGVDVRTRAPACGLARRGAGFAVAIREQPALECDRLVVATGGNAGPFEWLRELGHTIEEPVPSLFTLQVPLPELRALAGISVQRVRIGLPGTKLAHTGPVLLTHEGLSGPAVIQLSAWAAREFHARAYKTPIELDWSGGLNAEELRRRLDAPRDSHGTARVHKRPALEIPQRLWALLCARAGIGEDKTWAQLGRERSARLAAELSRCELPVDGRSAFKEEFVTCGGLRLDEMDFRTMESKLVPGLFLAGEVLDVDALTGGYNLQSAWTTGRLAGLAAGSSTAKATALPID